MRSLLALTGSAVAWLPWTRFSTVAANSNDECGLYLAPSLTSDINNLKWGIFAGVPIPAHSPVGPPDIAIHTHTMAGNAQPSTENSTDNLALDTVSFLEDYIWVADGMAGSREFDDNLGRVVAVVPGVGALAAFKPKSSNAAWDHRASFSRDIVGDHDTRAVPHIGRGASSHFYNVTMRSTEMITAGSEIYVFYGEAWEEDEEEDDEGTLDNADFEKVDQLVDQMIGFFDKYQGELTGVAKSQIYEFLVKDIVTAAAGSEKGKSIRKVLPNTPEELIEIKEAGGAHKYSAPTASRDLTWLQENGRCMDNIVMGASTIPYAGRGAFARRRIPTGGLVSPAPLVQLPTKDIMKMHEVTSNLNADKKRKFSRINDKVIGTQLLLNYCFGHPESSMLFFPAGSITSFINHSVERANVRMQFSDHENHQKDWYSVPPEKLLDGDYASLGLLMEIVALRDIEEGEEIFMDYGPEWQAAWDAHVERWNQRVTAGEIRNPWPIRALDLAHEYKTKPFPTVTEGTDYPDNIRQMCFLVTKKMKADGTVNKSWTIPKEGDIFDSNHLFDCRVRDRIELEEALPISNMPYNYTIEWFQDYQEADKAQGTGNTILNVPHSAIVFVDKPQTSDQFFPETFRHEIGIPDDVFPQGPWRNLVSQASAEEE